MASKIVQYIIVNGEITNALKWPLGRVIAQCCHATAAVNALYCDDIDTRKYFRNLDDMQKVIIQARDEESLLLLMGDLKKDSVAHRLWIEQPEKIATCIALKPYPEHKVPQYVRKLMYLNGNSD